MYLEDTQRQVKHIKIHRIKPNRRSNHLPMSFKKIRKKDVKVKEIFIELELRWIDHFLKMKLLKTAVSHLSYNLHITHQLIA